MDDDDGRKLSLFIGLQQEGLTSDEAERRVLALMPLDAVHPPGAAFLEETERRASAFAEAVEGLDGDAADALAVAELEQLHELAVALGEPYYAERFGRVLAGSADERFSSEPRPPKEWPTVTCPVCGQVGSIHPDEESPFAYRPGHLAFWTRECRQCGEWFAVEKQDPTHVELVDADVRSFVEDTITELGMNRWPSAAGVEPERPAATPESPRRAAAQSRLDRFRRYAASSRGRYVVAVAGVAIVGGGIAAGLALSSDDDGSSPAATRPNARVVIAASRRWQAREIVLTRDADEPVRRRVLVRVPAAANAVQVRVERPAGTPPPLLVTGSGDGAETRPLRSGRARIRLSERDADRRVVLVLRAPAGDGVLTLTVRVRTRGQAE